MILLTILIVFKFLKLFCNLAFRVSKTQLVKKLKPLSLKFQVLTEADMDFYPRGSRVSKPLLEIDFTLPSFKILDFLRCQRNLWFLITL